MALQEGSGGGSNNPIDLDAIPPGPPNGEPSAADSSQGRAAGAHGPPDPAPVLELILAS